MASSYRPSARFGLLVVAALVVGVALLLLWERDGTPQDPSRSVIESGAAHEPSDRGAAPEEQGLDLELDSSSDRAGRLGVPDPTLGSWQLLDWHQAPVAAAEVRVVRAGELLLSAKTDAAGRFAGLEGEPERASLLVVAAHMGPQILQLHLKPGPQVIVLPRGAVVAGQVVVDGQPPDEALALALLADQPLVRIEPTLGLTWGQLGLDPGLTARLVGATDDQGVFAFFGLAPDWSGQLMIPRHLRLVERSQAADRWWTRLNLERPVEGLRVELIRPLRILGRVIESAGGAPVAAASVRPDLSYADGARSRRLLDDLRADDEGRFELFLQSPGLLGGSLRILSPGHEVERVLAIEACDLVADLDLGDIPLRLDGGRAELALRILDRAGEPVPGAVATLASAGARASEPTDAEGRTTLGGLAPGLVMLRVLAIGYEVEEQPARVVEEGQEQVVVLRRSTLLRLRFLDSDGDVVERARVTLTTAEYPFAQERSWPSQAIMGKLGTSLHTRITRGAGVTLELTPVAEDRRVIVSGIRPGVPIELTVLSRFNTLLDERELAPLLPEEQRDLDIVLEQRSRSLRGRVLDEAGAPLLQASIGISYRMLDESRNGVSSSGRTLDEDAGFEFEEVFADHVALFARCDGYTPFDDARFEVPKDGRPVEIRLVKGRQVVVSVQDELGRPLVASVTAMTAAHSVLVGRGTEPGRYLIEGLPAEPVTVHLILGELNSQDSTFHSHPLEADQTELEVSFPVFGRVAARVSLPADADPNARRYLSLMPTAGAVGLRSQLLPAGELQALELRFEDVLPGAYRLVMRRRDMTELPAFVYAELGQGVSIEVRSGETSEADLWP